MSNKASTMWPFRKNDDKNCANCGKKFGFFDKKRVCWNCSSTFCGKCVKRVHDPSFSIIRSKKFCLPCYEVYDEEKKSIIRSNSVGVEEEKHEKLEHSNTTVSSPSEPAKPTGFFAALLP